MNVVRKILGIAAKVIVGIITFYLLLTLVLVPLISPWLIGSQASKLLKQTVKVRSVQVNPFLLRLTVKKFEILDANKQIMVGFDRFWTDVSFLNLLKKKYRVEIVALEGLKVNAVLTGDGSINLLGLVPANATKPDEVKGTSGKPQEQNAAPATSQAKPALPLVVVDLISLKNGKVTFTDKSVTPNFVTSLGDINVNVTGLSTNPEAETKVSFQAKLDDRGTISTEALLKPLAMPLSFEFVFKLNDYALQVLTPYVGKYTGHAVGSGKMNLSMDYRVADNKLDAKHKLLVQSFDFGQKVESKDALNLPFGLAIGLLEDSRGRIDISLPMTGDMSKPDFHYFHLIGQVLRNFFMKLVTKPFGILGSIVGADGSSSEELGYVRFEPGKTDLRESEKEKLNTVIKVLKERPKLVLKVKGGYDSAVDWRTIKTDVLNRDFKILKEESMKSESWVYQALYQRRFGMMALWRLTKSYRSKERVYDEPKLNEEIKRQLIEEGSPDKVALVALANTRAKVVYDFLIAAGFDAQRAGIGDPQESQASADTVPSELALTIFEDASSQTSEEPLLPSETKQ